MSEKIEKLISPQIDVIKKSIQEMCKSMLLTIYKKPGRIYTIPMRYVYDNADYRHVVYTLSDAKLIDCRLLVYQNEPAYVCKLTDRGHEIALDLAEEEVEDKMVIHGSHL